MKKLQIEKLVLGMMSTNCYLAVHKETKEAMIVDPASQAAAIMNRIKELKLKPAAILLTHGHFDHIGAAADLAEQYEIPIYTGLKEKEVLEDAALNLSATFGKGFTLHADNWLNDREMIEIAGFQIQALYTPGHTQGGLCYYLAEEGVLFSGDTLFYESVGRSDFPTGSMPILLHSVKELLRTLPDSTVIYPGHDSATDIAHEKKNNPFRRES